MKTLGRDDGGRADPADALNLAETEYSAGSG